VSSDGILVINVLAFFVSRGSILAYQIINAESSSNTATDFSGGLPDDLGVVTDIIIGSGCGAVRIRLVNIVFSFICGPTLEH